MKAVSVKNPWAMMIRDRRKTKETRTWATKYRGPLLIVSSKTPANQGPAGVALATCNLVGCRPMTKADESDACCPIYPGAYVWILEDIEPIRTPFPVKGQLGIYEVEYNKLCMR